MVPTLFYFNNL